MARVVKCDICGEEVERDSTAIICNEKWATVEITPIVMPEKYGFHYDMCPLCRDYLVNLLQQCIKAGKCPGGRE